MVMTQHDVHGAPPLDATGRQEMHALTRERMRFFLRFALTEGAVLAILIVLMYAGRIIDPDLGLYLLIGVALVGGVVLSVVLSRQMKRQQAIVAASEARQEAVRIEASRQP